MIVFLIYKKTITLCNFGNGWINENLLALKYFFNSITDTLSNKHRLHWKNSVFKYISHRVKLAVIDA